MLWPKSHGYEQNTGTSNKEVMMKYLEVNREIIDGEDGSLFSQLKRDSKQWSTERTPTTTR
jgi:hypothetical protein